MKKKKKETMQERNVRLGYYNPEEHNLENADSPVWQKEKITKK